jgi:hypothetical protein
MRTGDPRAWAFTHPEFVRRDKSSRFLRRRDKQRSREDRRCKKQYDEGSTITPAEALTSPYGVFHSSDEDMTPHECHSGFEEDTLFSKQVNLIESPPFLDVSPGDCQFMQSSWLLTTCVESILAWDDIEPLPIEEIRSCG